MGWSVQVHGVSFTVLDDGHAMVAVAQGGIRLGPEALAAVAQAAGAIAGLMPYGKTPAAVKAQAGSGSGPGRPRSDGNGEPSKSAGGTVIEQRGHTGAPGRPRSDGATGPILASVDTAASVGRRKGKSDARPARGRTAGTAPAKKPRGDKAKVVSSTGNGVPVGKVLAGLTAWMAAEPGPKSLAQLAEAALAQDMLSDAASAEAQVKSVISRERDRFVRVDGGYQLRTELVAPPAPTKPTVRRR